MHQIRLLVWIPQRYGLDGMSSSVIDAAETTYTIWQFLIQFDIFASQVIEEIISSDVGIVLK